MTLSRYQEVTLEKWQQYLLYLQELKSTYFYLQMLLSVAQILQLLNNVIDTQISSTVRVAKSIDRLQGVPFWTQNFNEQHHTLPTDLIKASHTIRLSFGSPSAGLIAMRSSERTSGYWIMLENAIHNWQHHKIVLTAAGPTEPQHPFYSSLVGLSISLWQRDFTISNAKILSLATDENLLVLPEDHQGLSIDLFYFKIIFLVHFIYPSFNPSFLYPPWFFCCVSFHFYLNLIITYSVVY